MTLTFIHWKAYDNSRGANFTSTAGVMILRQALFQTVSEIICRGYDNHFNYSTGSGLTRITGFSAIACGNVRALFMRSAQPSNCHLSQWTMVCTSSDRKPVVFILPLAEELLT